MRALYSIEFPVLIKELKFLEGFRVSRFYDTGNGRFFFRLRKGDEKANMQCILPYTLNVTEYVPQSPEPTGFAAAARKRIEDSVIESVEQLNCDRIVLIKLRNGDAKSEAIIELFGRGNFILADGNMRITLAYISHDFKDRSVRVGATYKPPSGAGIDAFGIARVNTAIKNVQNGYMRDSDVLSALASAVGIGRLYVEEALARAEVDPASKVKDVDARAFNRLEVQVNGVINECINSRMLTLYSKDGALVDFSLCGIKKYDALPVQNAQSFQNLLDTFYNQQVVQEVKESRESLELEKSIEKQRSHLVQIETESKELSACARLILGDMHRINAIIDFLKQNRHATKEDVQAVAQGIRILAVDLKDKSVRIEI